MATFDELTAQFTDRTAKADVLFDQGLHAALDALEVELAKAMQEDAQHNRDPLAPAIRERILELEAEVEAKTVTFHFAGIGNGAWIKLQIKHPPSRQDRAAGFDFDPETFCPAATAASANAYLEANPGSQPEITVANAKWMYEKLPDAEWSKVWRAVLTVNLGESNRPKSLLATLDRLAREESSIIAERMDSLDPSSSDE